MSAAGTRASGAAIASVVLVIGWAQREVSSHTAISTKHSLNSSDGWTDIGPTKTHRRAPDTVRPSTKTAISVPIPNR